MENLTFPLSTVLNNGAYTSSIMLISFLKFTGPRSTVKGVCLTADPGVASSIPAWSYTFVEIDHEIINSVILLPSAESFKGLMSVTSESMVNCLFKLAQEKVWLG